MRKVAIYEFNSKLKPSIILKLGLTINLPLPNVTITNNITNPRKGNLQTQINCLRPEDAR